RLPLMKDSFTRSDYVSLLRRFYGFYVPFERGILASPFSALLDDRSRIPALRRDFDALGVNIDPSLPFARLDAFAQAEECWGALYVMEGSTLGGRIITRHLSARFGMDRNEGLAFFEGHGAATGQRWKSFLSVMTDNHERCN